VHASATEAGLARSLELLEPEGTVLELSWYGDRRVSLPLGEAFHSRRLVVRSSQVGTVSPARSGRRDYGDRMALALRLLADPVFDALITGESSFDELPRVAPGLLGGGGSVPVADGVPAATADPGKSGTGGSGERPVLCHRIVYRSAQ
jgi:hypothetical protein